MQERIKMNLGEKIVRLFWLYVTGIVSAFVLGLCAVALSLFMAFLFGGNIYFAFRMIAPLHIMALPLGCALGMYLCDRWVSELPMYPTWRILIAFSLGLSGLILEIYLSQFVYWLPEIFTVGEIYLLFIIAIFSLVGYQLPSLFEAKRLRSQALAEGDGELAEEYNKTCGANEEKRHVFVGQILPLGILVILMAFVASYMKLVTFSDAGIEGRREFVGQIFASINGDTDFYKKHSAKEAIQKIQTYRPMISNNYDIAGERMSEAGQHYYYIVFNKTHRFEVFITGMRELTLQDIFYDKDGARGEYTYPSLRNKRK